MDVDEQVALITRGATECITERDLRQKLESGRSLRVKLGIDPTASDIHLGFAVVLRKLRQFQDLGHVAVLIIGDFTAQVGDPSGRNKTRPRLGAEEVDAHARSYLEQVTRILDPDPERLEVRHNSEWLAQMGMQDVLGLTASTTVARMLERDDFAKRYEEGSPITVMEFLYPLLQGRDSVVVAADVELGGTDQLFNLLVGRQLQQLAGQEPQVVLTTPLLPGISGRQKMSKSLRNYVGITEAPAEQFGKIMSIPDELLVDYIQHTTGWDSSRCDAAVAAIEVGPGPRARTKREVAAAVVDLYHGDGAGAAAEAEFDRVFKRGEAPTTIEEVRVDRTEFGADGRIRLAKVLALAGLVASNREGARKIAERGVRVDDEMVDDPDTTFSEKELTGRVISVGKRAWASIRVD